MKACLKLLVIGFALLISACGFQLRGFSDIPAWLDSVAVVSQEQNRDMMTILRERLEAWHVPVYTEQNRAHFWLFLGEETIQRQITNVAASTAPRQYQLIYTIRFWLQTREGAMRIAPASISIAKQLTINNDRILGSDEEEARMVHEMQQDAATQILARISREGMNSAKTAKPPVPRRH